MSYSMENKSMYFFWTMFTNIDLKHPFLGHKPKVISRGKEPVKIMNADGKFVDCSGVVFDTGNRAGTGISCDLVEDLNLNDKIDKEQTRPFVGVGRDDKGKSIRRQCNTIMVEVEIRHKRFPVRALVGVPVGKTRLLIGLDIINELEKEGFTLGK